MNDMRLHPCHEIPLGDDAPDEINLVAEVPRKTTAKYELDLELGILPVDRIMHPPVPYPANYVLLPRTLDEDKIICVHCDDLMCDDYHSVNDFPEYELRQIEWFFEDYQDVMHLDVDVEGFLGTDRAHRSIEMCRDDYREEFPDGCSAP